jgi:hypothetical protein
MREKVKRMLTTAWYDPKGGFFTSANDWQLRMNEGKNRQRMNNMYWKKQLDPTPDHYKQWSNRYAMADPFLRKGQNFAAPVSDKPMPLRTAPQPQQQIPAKTVAAPTQRPLAPGQ